MIGRVLNIVRRDAFAAAGSTAIRSLGRLAATISIARAAGVDGVAFVTLCVTIEIIIISALNALFAGPAAVLCPGRRSDLRHLIHRIAERSQLWAGLLLAAGGLVFFWARGLSSDVALPAMLFVLYLAVAAGYQAKRSTRVSEFRARPVLVWEIAIAVVAVGAPVVAAWQARDPVAWFWGGQLLVQLLALVSLSVESRRCASGVRAARVARAAILQTGGKMVAGSVAVSLAGRTQPLIIAAMLGPIVLGLYGAANAFAAPLRLAVASVRGVVLPRFAKAHRSGGVQTGAFNGWWIGVGAVCAAVGVGVTALVSPWLLRVAFGEAFVDAAPIVPLVLVHALIASVGALLGTLRQAQGMSGRCAVVRWLAALITPPLMVAGAMAGGVLGLLAALIVSEVIVVVMMLRMGIRREASAALRPAAA